MWTKRFWKPVAERSISTFAGSVIALAGFDQFSYLEVNWVQIAAISGVHAGLSVLKALATYKSNGTASVGALETPTPKAVSRHGTP